jgi:hypothetical protein
MLKEPLFVTVAVTFIELKNYKVQLCSMEIYAVLFPFLAVTFFSIVIMLCGHYRSYFSL